MKQLLEKEKRLAAQAAIQYLQDALDTRPPGTAVLGIGTGSTVRYFIESLPILKPKIQTTIASSIVTERALKDCDLPVTDLNNVSKIDYYIDGADECDPHLNMIKGGGGALTREKILATAAETFIGIADHSKWVKALGKFPLAIEVIPIARSLVARKITRLGGNPVYRTGFITDNQNSILDVYGLDISQPLSLEHTLTAIPGIVETGIFAHRRADQLFICSGDNVEHVTQ